MPGLSIVIPSKTVSNLVPCLSAIFANEKECRVIVVDDGIEWPNAEIKQFCHDPRVTIIEGVKPFIFARNVNLGIKAASDDDVIVLGDDGLMETPGGFTALWDCSHQHPDFGIISAACNQVGNIRQHLQPGRGLRVEPRMVCLIAALITRPAINNIGLLDERFTSYGEDDSDLCRRARNAGIKIGIYDGCFIDHSKLKSTFRSNPNQPADWQKNRAIYLEKWGSMD